VLITQISGLKLDHSLSLEKQNRKTRKTEQKTALWYNN